MVAYNEQNIQAPRIPPSADAGGELTMTNTTRPATALTPRNAIRPNLGWTSTNSCSAHVSSDPPRWQIVEYRHKDCDKCHAFMAFNSRFTTDTNSHYEKVVELALNTINVFHEVSLTVQSVNVSRCFEKATTRLVVEVATSAST